MPIINAHDKKLITPQAFEKNNYKTYNCIKEELCPLNNICLASNIIYQATIISFLQEFNEKIYIGLCQTTFKKKVCKSQKIIQHWKI